MEQLSVALRAPAETKQASEKGGSVFFFLGAAVKDFPRRGCKDFL